MANYHHTDQLGHSVTGARKAVLEAAEQLIALDEELAVERELHRDRELRLVERAEAAEARVAQLEDQVIGHQGSLAEANARIAELERWLANIEHEDLYDPPSC